MARDDYSDAVYTPRQVTFAAATRAVAVVAALSLGMAVGLAGCSSGDTAGALDGSDVGTSFGAPSGGTPTDTVDEPPAVITVDSGVSEDSVQVDDQITVFCTVQGLPPGALQPKTSWSFVTLPEGAAHEPVVDEDFVRFRSVGMYRISCELEEGGYIDPSPATIIVAPGPPVSVETSVFPTQLPAGETADIECTAEDLYGNTVEPDWEVSLFAFDGPEEGVVENNLVLTAVKVGTYTVRCVHAPTGVKDVDPVTVEVVAGWPERLVADLSHPILQAGQVSAITCRAEDAWGNEVAGVPMSIAVDTVLTVDGFTVWGTLSGSYNVSCVPAGADWSPFVIVPAVLTIQAAHAVSIEMSAQPPKPFYFLNQVIQLAVVARDTFHNVIPAPELAPVQVFPDGAQQLDGPLTISFDTEGVYTVSVSLATNPNLVASVVIIVEGSPPDLAVTFPPRGAALSGSKPSVTVLGTAFDAVAGIEEVWVNETPATLHDDGTWSAIIIPNWGLNVIHVETIDGAGSNDFLTQSFYFAEHYHVADGAPDYVPNGLRQWLAKTTIDDHSHVWGDPDDMATVLEHVVTMVDSQTLLPEPQEVGLGYELKLSQLVSSAPYLSLAPREGGLDVSVEYTSWIMKVAFENDCGGFIIDLCPDVSGSMTIDGVDVDAVLWASAVDGELTVQIDQATASIGHIDLSVDGLSTVLDILGWSSYAWIIDIVVDIIANIFSGQVGGTLAGGLGDALEYQLFQILHNMTVHDSYQTQPLLPGLGTASFLFDSQLDSLHFTDEGGRVGFGARVQSTNKKFQQIPGSIGRGTCLKGLSMSYVLPGVHEFEAAYRDDVVNAILTAVWRSGALDGEITLAAFPNASFLGGFELDGDKVQGLTIETEYLLPPILDGCHETDVLTIEVGDCYVTFDITSPALPGGSGTAAAYISFEMTAGLFVTPGQFGPDTLGMQLGSLTAIDYHWEQLPEPYQLDPEPLEAFVEEVFTKGVLAELGIPLGNFGIQGPGFADDIPGVAQPPTVDSFERENGHTTTQGQLP